MTRHRRLAALLFLFAYVLCIFDLALLHFHTRKPLTNLVPFHTIVSDWNERGRNFVVNFLGNIVAFMPIGLIPPLVRARLTSAWHAALFCLVLSSIIEAGQYVSGHRVADVDDLILNTFGGLLGYFLFYLGRWKLAARTELVREPEEVPGTETHES